MAKKRTAGITRISKGITDFPNQKVDFGEDDLIQIEGNVKGPTAKDLVGDLQAAKATALPKPLPLKETTPQSIAIDKQTAELKKTRQAGAVAGGVAAAVDMLNAYEQYIDRTEDAKTNIMLAEQDYGSIISSGKEESLRAESRGFSRGQDALLEAAIQGQEVSGEFAQNLQQREEAFGAMEALAIEVNSLRQAHGVRQEIVLLESEFAAAEQDFENQMINGSIRLGLALFGGA
jgi:hypothetical protein